jgi:quinol monooxygenase YgiN
MKVDVVAHIHAKPGLEKELQAVLEGFVAPTRLEEGCIRYDLFVDCDDPTKFTFIEEWSSREALAKHGQSAHITAGRTKFPELLAQPAWVQVATQIK